MFKDFKDSFKNTEGGYSGRKLSAFWAIVIVATYLSYKNANSENALYIIIAWLIFASVCLGLVTIPKLLETLTEIKNGKKDSNPIG